MEIHEADVDVLLRERSRKVAVESGKKSKLNFRKATFTSDKSSTGIDIEAEDFWVKVLGKDKRTTLIERTSEDILLKAFCELTQCEQQDLPSLLEQPREFPKWTDYINELFNEINKVAQEVIEEKLNGIAIPKWGSVVETSILQLQTMGRYSNLLLTEKLKKDLQQLSKYFLFLFLI